MGACCSTSSTFRFKNFVTAVYPSDVSTSKEGALPTMIVPNREALGRLKSYVATNPNRIPIVCRKIQKILETHLRKGLDKHVGLSLLILKELLIEAATAPTPTAPSAASTTAAARGSRLGVGGVGRGGRNTQRSRSSPSSSHPFSFSSSFFPSPTVLFRRSRSAASLNRRRGGGGGGDHPQRRGGIGENSNVFSPNNMSERRGAAGDSLSDFPTNRNRQQHNQQQSQHNHLHSLGASAHHQSNSALFGASSGTLTATSSLSVVPASTTTTAFRSAIDYYVQHIVAIVTLLFKESSKCEAVVALLRHRNELDIAAAPAQQPSPTTRTARDDNDADGGENNLFSSAATTTYQRQTMIVEVSDDGDDADVFNNARGEGKRTRPPPPQPFSSALTHLSTEGAGYSIEGDFTANGFLNNTCNVGGGSGGGGLPKKKKGTAARSVLREGMKQAKKEAAKSSAVAASAAAEHNRRLNKALGHLFASVGCQSCKKYTRHQIISDAAARADTIDELTEISMSYRVGAADLLSQLLFYIARRGSVSDQARRLLSSVIEDVLRPTLRLASSGLGTNDIVALHHRFAAIVVIGNLMSALQTRLSYTSWEILPIILSNFMLIAKPNVLALLRAAEERRGGRGGVIGGGGGGYHYQRQPLLKGSSAIRSPLADDASANDSFASTSVNRGGGGVGDAYTANHYRDPAAAEEEEEAALNDHSNAILFEGFESAEEEEEGDDADDTEDMRGGRRSKRPNTNKTLHIGGGQDEGDGDAQLHVINYSALRQQLIEANYRFIFSRRANSNISNGADSGTRGGSGSGGADANSGGVLDESSYWNGFVNVPVECLISAVLPLQPYEKDVAILRAGAAALFQLGYCCLPSFTRQYCRVLSRFCHQQQAWSRYPDFVAQTFRITALAFQRRPEQIGFVVCRYLCEDVMSEVLVNGRPRLDISGVLLAVRATLPHVSLEGFRSRIVFELIRKLVTRQITYFENNSNSTVSGGDFRSATDSYSGPSFSPSSSSSFFPPSSSAAASATSYASRSGFRSDGGGGGGSGGGGSGGGGSGGLSPKASSSSTSATTATAAPFEAVLLLLRALVNCVQGGDGSDDAVAAATMGDGVAPPVGVMMGEASVGAAGISSRRGTVARIMSMAGQQTLNASLSFQVMQRSLLLATAIGRNADRGPHEGAGSRGRRPNSVPAGRGARGLTTMAGSGLFGAASADRYRRQQQQRSASYNNTIPSRDLALSSEEGAGRGRLVSKNSNRNLLVVGGVSSSGAQTVKSNKTYTTADHATANNGSSHKVAFSSEAEEKVERERLERHGRFRAIYLPRVEHDYRLRAALLGSCSNGTVLSPTPSSSSLPTASLRTPPLPSRLHSSPIPPIPVASITTLSSLNDLLNPTIKYFFESLLDRAEAIAATIGGHTAAESPLSATMAMMGDGRPTAPAFSRGGTTRAAVAATVAGGSAASVNMSNNAASTTTSHSAAAAPPRVVLCGLIECLATMAPMMRRHAALAALRHESMASVASYAGPLAAAAGMATMRGKGGADTAASASASSSVASGFSQRFLALLAPILLSYGRWTSFDTAAAYVAAARQRAKNTTSDNNNNAAKSSNNSSKGNSSGAQQRNGGNANNKENGAAAAASSLPPPLFFASIGSRIAPDPLLWEAAVKALTQFLTPSPTEEAYVNPMATVRRTEDAAHRRGVIQRLLASQQQQKGDAAKEKEGAHKANTANLPSALNSPTTPAKPKGTATAAATPHHHLPLLPPRSHVQRFLMSPYDHQLILEVIGLMLRPSDAQIALSSLQQRREAATQGGQKRKGICVGGGNPLLFSSPSSFDGNDDEEDASAGRRAYPPLALVDSLLERFAGGADVLLTVASVLPAHHTPQSLALSGNILAAFTDLVRDEGVPFVIPFLFYLQSVASANTHPFVIVDPPSFSSSTTPVTGNMKNATGGGGMKRDEGKAAAQRAATPMSLEAAMMGVEEGEGDETPMMGRKTNSGGGSIFVSCESDEEGTINQAKHLSASASASPQQPPGSTSALCHCLQHLVVAIMHHLALVLGSAPLSRYAFSVFRQRENATPCEFGQWFKPRIADRLMPRSCGLEAVREMEDEVLASAMGNAVLILLQRETVEEHLLQIAEVRSLPDEALSLMLLLPPQQQGSGVDFSGSADSLSFRGPSPLNNSSNRNTNTNNSTSNVIIVNSGGSRTNTEQHDGDLLRSNPSATASKSKSVTQSFNRNSNHNLKRNENRRGDGDVGFTATTPISNTNNDPLMMLSASSSALSPHHLGSSAALLGRGGGAGRRPSLPLSSSATAAFAIMLSSPQILALRHSHHRLPIVLNPEAALDVFARTHFPSVFVSLVGPRAAFTTPPSPQSKAFGGVPPPTHISSSSGHHNRNMSDFEHLCALLFPSLSSELDVADDGEADHNFSSRGGEGGANRKKKQLQQQRAAQRDLVTACQLAMTQRLADRPLLMAVKLLHGRGRPTTATPRTAQMTMTAEATAPQGVATATMNTSIRRRKGGANNVTTATTTTTNTSTAATGEIKPKKIFLTAGLLEKAGLTRIQSVGSNNNDATAADGMLRETTSSFSNLRNEKGPLPLTVARKKNQNDESGGSNKSNRSDSSGQSGRGRDSTLNTVEGESERKRIAAQGGEDAEEDNTFNSCTEGGGSADGGSGSGGGIAAKKAVPSLSPASLLTEKNTNTGGKGGGLAAVFSHFFGVGGGKAAKSTDASSSPPPNAQTASSRFPPLSATAARAEAPSPPFSSPSSSPSHSRNRHSHHRVVGVGMPEAVAKRAPQAARQQGVGGGGGGRGERERRKRRLAVLASATRHTHHMLSKVAAGDPFGDWPWWSSSCLSDSQRGGGDGDALLDSENEGDDNGIANYSIRGGGGDGALFNNKRKGGGMRDGLGVFVPSSGPRWWSHKARDGYHLGAVLGMGEGEGEASLRLRQRQEQQQQQRRANVFEEYPSLTACAPPLLLDVLGFLVLITTTAPPTFVSFSPSSSTRTTTSHNTLFPSPPSLPPSVASFTGEGGVGSWVGMLRQLRMAAKAQRRAVKEQRRRRRQVCGADSAEERSGSSSASSSSFSSSSFDSSLLSGESRSDLSSSVSSPSISETGSFSTAEGDGDSRGKSSSASTSSSFSSSSSSSSDDIYDDKGVAFEVGGGGGGGGSCDYFTLLGLGVGSVGGSCRRRRRGASSSFAFKAKRNSISSSRKRRRGGYRSCSKKALRFRSNNDGLPFALKKSRASYSSSPSPLYSSPFFIASSMLRVGPLLARLSNAVTEPMLHRLGGGGGGWQGGNDTAVAAPTSSSAARPSSSFSPSFRRVRAVMGAPSPKRLASQLYRPPSLLLAAALPTTVVRVRADGSSVFSSSAHHAHHGLAGAAAVVGVDEEGRDLNGGGHQQPLHHATTPLLDPLLFVSFVNSASSFTASPASALPYPSPPSPLIPPLSGSSQSHHQQSPASLPSVSTTVAAVRALLAPQLKLSSVGGGAGIFFAGIGSGGVEGNRGGAFGLPPTDAGADDVGSVNSGAAFSAMASGGGGGGNTASSFSPQAYSVRSAAMASTVFGVDPLLIADLPSQWFAPATSVVGNNNANATTTISGGARGSTSHNSGAGVGWGGGGDAALPSFLPLEDYALLRQRLSGTAFIPRSKAAQRFEALMEAVAAEVERRQQQGFNEDRGGGDDGGEEAGGGASLAEGGISSLLPAPAAAPPSDERNSSRQNTLSTLSPASPASVNGGGVGSSSRVRRGNTDTSFAAPSLNDSALPLLGSTLRHNMPIAAAAARGGAVKEGGGGGNNGFNNTITNNSIFGAQQPNIVAAANNTINNGNDASMLLSATAFLGSHYNTLVASRRANNNANNTNNANTFSNRMLGTNGAANQHTTPSSTMSPSSPPAMMGGAAALASSFGAVGMGRAVGGVGGMGMGTAGRGSINNGYTSSSGVTMRFNDASSSATPLTPSPFSPLNQQRLRYTNAVNSNIIGDSNRLSGAGGNEGGLGAPMIAAGMGGRGGGGGVHGFSPSTPLFDAAAAVSGGGGKGGGGGGNTTLGGVSSSILSRTLRQHTPTVGLTTASTAPQNFSFVPNGSIGGGAAVSQHNTSANLNTSMPLHHRSFADYNSAMGTGGRRPPASPQQPQLSAAEGAPSTPRKSGWM